MANDATASACMGDGILPLGETTAQAVATMDARFPWLRAAERRCDRRRL